MDVTCNYLESFIFGLERISAFTLMRDGERERFEWIYVMRANETILDLRESVRELLLDKDYDH